MTDPLLRPLFPRYERAPLVTVEEAARVMGRSEEVVRQLALAGILEYEIRYGELYVRPALVSGAF